MPDFSGTIDAPVLKTLAKELLVLLRSDQRLREVQGLNAPRACYFDRSSITGNTLYTISQALSGTGEIFSSMSITVDQASGLGFYRLDGVAATPTVGVEIPAGGGLITISGHDNIRGFSMIAQAAATLTFSRYLFK